MSHRLLVSAVAAVSAVSALALLASPRIAMADDVHDAPISPAPPAPKPDAGTTHLTMALGGGAASVFGLGAEGAATNLGLGVDRRAFRFEIEGGYARLFAPYGVALDQFSAGLTAFYAPSKFHAGAGTDLSLLGFRRGELGSYVSSLGLGMHGAVGVDVAQWETHAISLDARAGVIIFDATVVPEGKLLLTLRL